MAYNEYEAFWIEGLSYTYHPENKLELICLDEPEKYCPMLLLCCSREMVFTIYKHLISHFLKVSKSYSYGPESGFSTIFDYLGFAINSDQLSYRYNAEDDKVPHMTYFKNRDRHLEETRSTLVEDTRNKKNSLLYPETSITQL